MYFWMKESPLLGMVWESSSHSSLDMWDKVIVKVVMVITNKYEEGEGEN